MYASTTQGVRSSRETNNAGDDDDVRSVTASLKKFSLGTSSNSITSSGHHHINNDTNRNHLAGVPSIILQEHILPHLHTKAICALQSTCKELRYELASDRLWWGGGANSTMGLESAWFQKFTT